MSSRRKAIVAKRMEYVDDISSESEEETPVKTVKSLKRRRSNSVNENSDTSEWIPFNKNPKMMKVNRTNPVKSSMDHDYDIDLNDLLNDPNKKYCTNRNALIARKNRIKKKLYVDKLENTISELKSNFISMQKQLDEQNELINKVQKENKYLRSVLANSSGLKQILHGIRLAGISSNPNQPSVPHLSTTSSSNSKVHVTDSLMKEDNFPSSTSDPKLSPLEEFDYLLEENKKWMDSNMKPVPEHDFSSNPQLYYDTIKSRRSSTLPRSDLQR